MGKFLEDERGAEQEFVRSFTDLSNQIHHWAVHKGFWTEGQHRNDGEMIAQMIHKVRDLIQP
ncbi:hypothetical protein GS597_15185 [Synechococcales cyanobacterium C]|uniref:Uncharacterized protein n=1 Tax=Petrachloros mirabilis ULC683 TaxID=2781853 RepID=A0A8K2A118_9CYAN|nr:hypothetical protein [Petrachloros mirabilis]NCJ07827.1 hypothetical protein [Petrachloros mirabilis ULC683]